ncbi:transketolase [Atopobiaceae bacterium 24-176]
MDTRALELAANDLRHDIIAMLAKSRSGHPGGSLSAADIMAALFFSGVMDYNASDPNDHSRDRFFLSKGHAAPVLYAVYHRLGWLDDEDLMTLRQLGSKLQGHPDSHACPGVEVCSGSLGQGLSVSAGCALGLKLDAEAAGTAPQQVFCLLGDGELQEGSNWEALMFAAHRGLDNLCAIVDLNNLQIDGHVTDVCSLGDIDAKLAAFGWSVTRVNGHDMAAVTDALAAAKAAAGAPQAIVCETIKGKGVSFMEDQASWHGNAPSAEQAAAAIAELDAARALIEKEA